MIFVTVLQEVTSQLEERQKPVKFTKAMSVL